MSTLNLTQVAKEVGVSRFTLERMIRDKRFPVKPIKGTKPRRWKSEKVKAWKNR